MVIVKEELPYAYVVSTPINCHFCCRGTMEPLQRCSACKFARYCDKECQKSAWEEHRQECVQLKKMYPVVPVDMVRLMGRIIFKQQAKPETNKDGERTFEMLMSHAEKIRNDPLRKWSEVFVSACLYLHGVFNLPSESELLEIYGKLCVNSFEIMGNDGDPIGQALYLQMSELDHSCSPDAMFVFEGRKVMLKLLNQSEGSQSVYSKNLTINYVDLLQTKAERKLQLKEQYHFDCQCRRCSNTDTYQDDLLQALICQTKNCDGAVLISQDGGGLCDTCHQPAVNVQLGLNLMARIQKYRTAEFETLGKKEDWPSLYDLTTALLKESASLLHSINIYRIRVLEAAKLACLGLGKFDEALECYRLFLLGYRRHSGPGHPLVTHTLKTMATVLQSLGRLSEAADFFGEALDEAIQSHGDDHELCSELYQRYLLCGGDEPSEEEEEDETDDK